MPPVVEERLAEIAQLCRRHRVARLELFGSAAAGRFRPGESDLDFLVTFEPEAPLDGLADYFDLADGLQALFGAPADLVVAEAIRNPYFRHAVDAGPRSPLYESPSAPERPRPVPHTAPGASLMELRTKKLLYDIARAAGAIMEFTEGKTLDDYRSDLMLRSAVERQFEIIGEAAARLARFDKATAERISGCRKIIGFRNIVAHAYHDLDDSQAWACVRENVPTLRREANGLLGEPPVQ